MCCPQPPSMWSYPRTHRAAHLRPLRACLQHDVAGMPLPRELDGGGAEDGLGALPGLRAQVPEVQMFAEGAYYFQAAQGAAPPRYDVKPLEVCEVDRPASSLDANFLAGLAEVDARMAREQQQHLQWFQAAQAASQQAVHSAPAAERDVVPHVVRGSYTPLQHPTAPHHFMPQQKPLPQRGIALDFRGTHPPSVLPSSPCSSPLGPPLLQSLPGQQLAPQLGSQLGPRTHNGDRSANNPSEQVDLVLAAMRRDLALSSSTTPTAWRGTSRGPPDDPPCCSGGRVAQQPGRTLFSPCAQTHTAAHQFSPPPPPCATLPGAASLSSPCTPAPTAAALTAASPQLPALQPERVQPAPAPPRSMDSPHPSMSRSGRVQGQSRVEHDVGHDLEGRGGARTRVYRVWLLVDASDTSRGQPVALPDALQRGDPSFGVLGHLTVSPGASPPDTATAGWAKPCTSEEGPPEDHASFIAITPGDVMEGFCSISFATDQPRMHVLRSVAGTSLVGDQFDASHEQQQHEDFVFQVPAEQKEVCAILLGRDAPPLVDAVSDSGTCHPKTTSTVRPLPTARPRKCAMACLPSSSHPPTAPHTLDSPQPALVAATAPAFLPAVPAQ